MKNPLNSMQMLLAFITVAALAACASMGRPEGGARDENPPVFLGSNPPVGGLNVSNQKITLTFDENIQLEDPSNKIVVSPAQAQAPAISSGGKKVTIELRDSLLPNTTYTIDFADAIKDLNEGNILDGLAIDFATGDTIDSLRISGMVLEGRTLEPAQGILVGVYSNLSDTAISTLKMERIAKTNQLGQFTIRNLKPGTYQIFALNDMNRDWKWDRSEDVAFYDSFITPTSEPAEVADTFVAVDGSDSIVTRPATHYMPDDILLTWFNENYKSQYMSDYSRKERNKLHVQFGAPSDTMPALTLINGPKPDMDASQWAIPDYSATRDTITYWITDTSIAHQDTLMIAARYLRTDTLDQLSWTTDTLKFQFRAPKAKKEKPKKEKESKKNVEMNDSDSVTVDMPELEFIDFRVTSPTTQEVNMPLLFTAPEPLDTFIQQGVHLEILVDSLWETLEAPVIYRPHPNRLLEYQADYKWTPGEKYRLTVDSAAITGIYGLWNKPISHEFTARKIEEYSSVTFNVTGLDSIPAVAELLSTSDNPVTTVPVTDGIAQFNYVLPGTYYARLFIDRNGNGTYDNGSLTERRQPEDVYYYPKKINLKKNWDVSQTWNIDDVPVDMQKPLDIKKNKPKLRKGEQEERRSDEEEDDEFNNGGFGANPFGGNQYGNQYGRNNNFGNTRLR